MPRIEQVKSDLEARPRKWLVTGVAGFIGSNLLEALLNLGQFVVGLDDLSTGYRQNLQDVRNAVGGPIWERFTFCQADVADMAACRRACEGVDYVLHQAALASVPRSIDDPVASNRANIDGFLNMLIAARDAGVKKFVYASSSSVYGDDQRLPKVEEKVGRPLSPYALTKYVNELYADLFAATYDLPAIGLRYFNVFGKRQDPDGAYAAVIPKWVSLFLQGRQPIINGDGETSRDFCYIDNVIQANLLAAVCDNGQAAHGVYNIACGEQTNLNQLYQLIRENLIPYRPEVEKISPRYGPFRKGDVRHSLADITKAREFLGYQPTCHIGTGMKLSIPWYMQALS